MNHRMLIAKIAKKTIRSKCFYGKNVLEAKEDRFVDEYKIKKAVIKNITAFLRCLAESNRLERFCRPLPNRSDKAPVSCFI